MGDNDKRRSMVLHRVEDGALTLEQATRVLGLSYRQMKRVWKRFREEGDLGLAHRSKGRPSNRAFMDEFKAEVLEKYHAQAEGMGPTQFAGVLRDDGVTIDHETLRRWLLDTGGWQLSRSRHARRSAPGAVEGFGELLTLVSEQESWLGESEAGTFLLCLSDEATSARLCLLSADESSEGAMRLLRQWVDRYGLPAALRCPRRFIYEENRHPSLEEQLTGGQARSAFSVCCERLGIATECLSPTQAKYLPHDMRPLMDRVREELLSRRTASVEEANALLAGGLADPASSPRAPTMGGHPDFHVPIVDGTDLRRYFCVEHECRVTSSGIVEHGRRRFRLLNGAASLGRQARSVLVSEWLDGSVHIMADRAETPFLELSKETAQRSSRLTAGKPVVDSGAGRGADRAAARAAPARGTPARVAPARGTPARGTPARVAPAKSTELRGAKLAI
jgi:transposase